jgi:hypothetical protein
VHELADFLDSVVTVANRWLLNSSPAAGGVDAVNSLIRCWRKELPAYIVPVVAAALEALPADLEGARSEATKGAGVTGSSPAAQAAIEEAKASAEAAARILVSIKQLELPVPRVAVELVQLLLPRLMLLVEPRRVGDVLQFVAQQQQRRFKV